MIKRRKAVPCKFCPGPAKGNEGIQCVLGFTQNPMSVDAAKKFFANGGKRTSICFRNEWRAGV